MQRRQLAAHLAAEGGVQVRERLVEQEDARLAHDRATDRDALPLASRELARASVEQCRETERFRGDGNALDHLGIRAFPEAKRERHVLPDGHVRIERIALEDHRDVTVRGRHVVDHAPSDGERAAGDRLESGDHSQRRALAASGRADQHHELPGPDGEIDAMHGDDSSVIFLAYAVQLDRRGCLRRCCHLTLPVSRVAHGALARRAHAIPTWYA